MDEPPDLLHELRLDRTAPAERRRLGWRFASTIGIVVVTGSLLTGWLLHRGSALVTEKALPSERVFDPRATAPSVRRSQALEASGYVVARRQASVSANTTGRVRDVFVEEGQHVASRQVIARLDDDKARAGVDEASARLGQAQADLDSARIAAENASPIYRRLQTQYTSGFISAQAFDGARSTFEAAQADRKVKERAVDVVRASLAIAQRNLEETVVRAPFAGMITVKAAQPGEIVSPLSASGGFARTGIGTIVDMDSLEVEVDVSETSIGGIRPGQSATVHLNAYPDWDIPAETIAIIPTADRARATVKVRVGLKAKDARILPEMGARVSFLIG